MDYVALNVACTGGEQAEILTAELADYAFESFETEGCVLKAYIRQDLLADCKAEIDALLVRYGVEGRYISIETQNWNALWESNFPAVDVEGRLLIRAPFHDPAPDGEPEVVVMPKMSFGTGHHATTWLMSRAVLDLGVAGRTGLDMGSGTGVLAIVAAKCGARHLDAVDIDAGRTPTAGRTSRRTAWPTASSRCWAMSAALPADATTSSWPTSTAISSRPTWQPMPRHSFRAGIW